MSVKASSWAWQVRVDSPTTKLVLVALADFADDAGIAWPSMDTLAAMTQLSRRSIVRGVLEAKNKGLLEVTKRGNTSSRYRLILAPPLLVNLPSRSATESQQEKSRSATESQHEVPHSPPVVPHRRIASATESQNPSRNRQRTTIEPSSTAPEGAARTNGHSGMIEDLFGDEGDAEPKKAAKGKADRGTRIPDDWQPSDVDLLFAKTQAIADVDRLVTEFRNYWRGIPGWRGRKVDWSATFQNRVLAVADRQAGKVNGNGHAAPPRDFDAERRAERSRRMREMLAEDLPK